MASRMELADGHREAHRREALVPASLGDPNALRFWIAVILTGVAAGLGAAALTALLEQVQGHAWGAYEPSALMEAARRVGPWRHVLLLLSAGLLTGVGQWLLTRLASGNGIDITAAIWFRAGRLPTMRTLGSAALSIVIVGMGATLGREGAPKQAGAVFGNLASDLGRLSDEQRRLLVAIGAGAGMAAVYSVPLGGAIFALEVLRGKLSLRLVLPALAATTIATGVATIVIPNAPIYRTPPYAVGLGDYAFAALAAPVVGIWSVGFVRLIAWADRVRPSDWRRLVAPPLVFLAVGVVSIPFPEVLGNGQDVAQAMFRQPLAPLALLVLLPVRPLCTVGSVASGAPGGLFTSSLAAGALMGGALGALWLRTASVGRPRPVRDPRRGRDAGGDHARPDLRAGPDDGADRAGAPVRDADADRHRRRHGDIAQHRNALGLRGATDRRGSGRAAEGQGGRRGKRSPHSIAAKLTHDALRLLHPLVPHLLIDPFHRRPGDAERGFLLAGVVGVGGVGVVERLAEDRLCVFRQVRTDGRRQIGVDLIRHGASPFRR